MKKEYGTWLVPSHFSQLVIFSKYSHINTESNIK